MKRWVALFLVLVMLSCQIPSSLAAQQDSVINSLYPTEEEMKVNTDVELEYKKVPPEHYRWDTALQYVEMDGILPKFNNPGDVTGNTIFGEFFRAAVAIVRFGVFLLQMGFSTNVLTSAIDEIDDKVMAVSDLFMQRVFPIASLLLIIFVAVAWARGQRGEMVRLFLGAFIVSSLLMVGVKNVDTLARATSDIIDEVSLMVLGVTNLDGNMDAEAARESGVRRLAETTNLLWKVAVDIPWTVGQFGSRTPPTITNKERYELNNKNIQINPGDTWKELFLRYAPGTVEREALVDVLADEDIQHANPYVSSMMRELGPSVRAQVGGVSLLVAVVALILFGIVAGLMILSGFLLLGGIVVSPIVIPLPFLARIGMNLVKKYLSYLVSFAVLKVSATIYLSIVMLFIYFLTLFPTLHVLVMQGITLLIMVVGIFLAPNIWRRMTPGLATISGIGERAVRNVVRKAAPEKLEDLVERFGFRHREVDAENLMQRSPEVKNIDATREELATLRELKSEDPQQFAVSGLETREAVLNRRLRLQEISGLPLLQLQERRKAFEQRIEAGNPLSGQEREELRFIQEQERQRIRSMLQPQDRQALERVWNEAHGIYQKQNELRQLKVSDPLAYVQQGGDMRMRYLQQREEMNRQREQELLRQYMKPISGLSPGEQRVRDELRQYVQRQSEGIMFSHLDNLASHIPGEERRTQVENMSRDELQQEHAKYLSRLEQGEELSAQDWNDWMYVQHQEWMKTIEGMDQREELEGLYFKELNLESQIKELDLLKANDPFQFLRNGGREKREALQQSLYDTRQQAQEILRHSGYRAEADRHLQFSEHRDMYRERTIEPYNTREQQLQEEGRAHAGSDTGQERNPMVQPGQRRESLPQVQPVQPRQTELSNRGRDMENTTNQQNQRMSNVRELNQMQEHQQRIEEVSISREARNDVQQNPLSPQSSQGQQVNQQVNQSEGTSVVSLQEARRQREQNAEQPVENRPMTMAEFRQMMRERRIAERMGRENGPRNP